MQDSQILSALGGRWRGTPPRPSAPTLVFDACEVGVVLRAVLYVELVVAVGLMFVAAHAVDWLMRVATITAGVLPATLLWLVVCCGLKRPLARLNHGLQLAAGVSLGALAGLLSAALLAMVLPATEPAWLASACTGALLAAGLVAGLIWRVRGRTPAATAARLAELQARIRPHFLFNALNSAIALVREDPVRAEAVLEDLSDLFRQALVERSDSSTLAQEIALARRYLDIEQVRFGPRLRVQWSLDEKVSAARLPPLILQPLVENAVVHGVEPSIGGADVHISTQKRGETAVIKVTNTVSAPDRVTSGHGMALANVRERLRLLHDLQSGFRAGLVDKVYQVRIVVPAVSRKKS